MTIRTILTTAALTGGLVTAGAASATTIDPTSLILDGDAVVGIDNLVAGTEVYDVAFLDAGDFATTFNDLFGSDPVPAGLPDFPDQASAQSALNAIQTFFDDEDVDTVNDDDNNFIRIPLSFTETTFTFLQGAINFVGEAGNDDPVFSDIGRETVAANLSYATFELVDTTHPGDPGGPSEVPLPAPIALLATALGGLTLLRRRA